MRDELHNIETTDYSDFLDITDDAEAQDMSAWSDEYSTRHARIAAVPYRKRQIVKAAAVLLFFLMLMIVTVLFATQTGYAIYMNGAELGSAKDIEEVAQAVENVENQVSEILGYDYSIKDSIEVGAARASIGSASTTLEDAILENVDEICKLYTLKIDGEAVAATDNADAFDKMLSGILDRYSSDDTTSVFFDETITIAREYIKTDILQDLHEIQTLIDPSNSDSKISLTVNNVERIERDIDVDYDCEYIYDDTVYEGTDTVLVTGAKGVSHITESVKYVNGVEEGRQLLDTQVLSEPVNEVVSIGTKYRPYYVSYGEYYWPADGILTSKFGPRSGGIGSSDHQGIDIAGSAGQYIYAADGGEVIFADWQSGYGYLIQIQHDNGDITCYAHCTSFAVAEGDLVGRGDLIAYMGSTGVSSGNHVHFEIRRDGTPVNPLDYLS